MMSARETTVRQLQYEKGDETLVTTAFIGAGSLIQKSLAHSKSARKVSTGMTFQLFLAIDFANMMELLSGMLSSSWLLTLIRECVEACGSVVPM